MRRPVHSLVFFSAPVDSILEEQPIIEYRFIDAIGELPSLPLELEQFIDVYRARFMIRHRAVIVEKDSRLVFLAWVACDRLRVDELEREWEIPDSDRVIYDVFTAPNARGRGIYPGALRWLRSVLHRSGAQRCWIYADSGNSPSLRGIRKAGFASMGRIIAVHFGKGVLFGSIDGVELCRA